MGTTSVILKKVRLVFRNVIMYHTVQNQKWGLVGVGSRQRVCDREFGDRWKREGENGWIGD